MAIVSNKKAQLLSARVQRTSRRRLLGMLAVFVVVATVAVLMVPAISMTRGELVCGLEEHEHTDACYEQVLICGYDSDEAAIEAGHEHTDACYELRLTCETPEHVHSSACYDEPVAVQSDDSKDEEIQPDLDGQVEEGEQSASDDEVVQPAANDDMNDSEMQLDKENDSNSDDDLIDDGDDGQANDTVVKDNGENANTDDSDANSNAGDSNATENDSNANATMPAQAFDGELIETDEEGVEHVALRVHVEAPKGAFPADTTMQIKEVVSEQIIDAVDEAVTAKTDGKVRQLQAVDITFLDADENPIEPERDITVTLESPLVAQTEKPLVVHVDDEGKADVVDTLTKKQLKKRNIGVEEDQLLFDSSDFSIYGIVATTLEQTLVASDGQTYTITVNCPPETGVPEDASLDVTEVLKSDDEWADYTAQVGEELNEDVEFARFFDIDIVDANGNEIQPEVAVNVKISLADAKEIGDEMKVVHFGDDGLEFVDATLADDTVAFEAGGFSVYGVVGVETLETTVLTDEGKTLKVTVNYDEKAQIPEDATLEVKEVTEGDEEWGDRSARLAHALSEEYGNYYISDARFLNISIMVDGKEFEPKAPVEIVVEYTDPMQTEYIVDTVDTDPNGIGEFAGLDEEPQMTSHFAVVHYEDDNPQVLDAEIEKSEDLITESITMTPSFSDYDFVNLDVYEAREVDIESLPGAIGALKASDVAFATKNEEDAPALRNVGDVPNHSKSLKDNQNGTYTIGLNVEGDADTTSEASDVNVIIVYDVSSSMTIYHAPSATGRYGAPTSAYSTTYTTLYYQQSSNNYQQLTNDTYTGTVYTRTRVGNRYQYNEYTGKRYSALWRADEAEKTLYDFTHALFGYQNAEKDNINAAVVTFDSTTHSLPRSSNPPTWTTNESDITGVLNGSGIGHANIYGSGTNWEGAMIAANNLVQSVTNDAPTYVVFITDGAPTQSQSQSTKTDDFRRMYNHAKDNARDVYLATQATGGEFFGIYAYGEEADWLASLMYYAANNSDPSSGQIGTTFAAPGYYNASDATALTAAINEIFQKIVQTLGVTEVSITDGTTSNVATSTGVAHLLVVEDSYQYWLSLPVVAGTGGTYTFSMPDKTTGNNVTYTVTPNAAGENVTISWDGGSVTYPGNVDLNKLTIEWTQATAFYSVAPPAASYSSITGTVEWNLHSAGTLLDGVTYTVTFDCYPSQETLDLIADLKNGDLQYSDLDPAIKQYLTEDYQLKTNTTATLSYTDTRPEGGSNSVDYVNPDPQPVNATEEITVSKKWSNSLDSREGWERDLELYVKRDGHEVHAVDLNQDNHWTNTAWISYGIITEDASGVHLKTTGHDYSFSEDVETGYYWEIKAPTVRPMLINNDVTLLKLVDVSEAPDAIKNASGANAKALVDGDTYYKLTIPDPPNGDKIEYYVVVEDVSAALTATNHRRSYLDVVKTVTGGNIPEGDAFTFTMEVNNANAETANPEDFNSDAWIWFSIWDINSSAMVKDPDAATASEMRWQLNNETVVAAKPPASSFNGYFCVPSGASITAYMQKGYSLRFLNLPEGTTYTISESETMPAEGYSFVSIAGTRSYDADYDSETTDDWTTESTGTVTGQSITGTIEYVESAYKVDVTNKYNTIDVQLKKVDENGTVLDGSTFTLSSGETTVGTYQPNQDNGNPVDLGGLGPGIYKLEETEAPTYYQTAEDIYFQVYKDTDGSLKARLVNSDGTILSDQSAISSTTGTDGNIYTITVTDVRKTAKVKVTKNVVGFEGDQSKEFEFTIAGVSENNVTAQLVGDIEADNHSVIYEDIPYGTSITVSETANNAFATAYSVNRAQPVSGTIAEFTVDDLTVNASGVAEVVFTNTRSSQLIKVFKYETGTSPEKALEGAVFSLSGPDGTGVSYTGLMTNDDGYLECNNSIYIELPVDESSYTLTETAPPAGYYAINENAVLTVSINGVSATGAGYSVESGTETVGGVEVTVYTIKVANSAGVALPNTGGPGNMIFTVFGSILVLLAGALFAIGRKRQSAQE